MSKFELYGLYCPDTNEIKYVGITKNGLNNRLRQHLKSPTNQHIELWFNDLKICGKIPIIKQIKECESYDDLLLSEIKEIKNLKKNKIKLYNILEGGITNPMLGRIHSEKTKKLISEKNKGRVISDLTKRKISETLINKWRDNPDWGEKKSINYKGYNNPFYGKTHSEISKIKRRNTINENGGCYGENNHNYKYNIDVDVLKDLYLNQNKTIVELSKIYGCHINTINNKLREFKIFKPKSNIYGLNNKEILNYLISGFNYIQIGEKFGCSNKIIYKYIKKHNLYVK